MSIDLSKDELEAFDMSSHEESNVNGVLKDSTSVFRSVYIPEEHWFVHFLVIKAHSFGPVQIHDGFCAPRVNENFYSIVLHGVQGLHMSMIG